MISPTTLTQELVKINSINPPGNESQCARLLGPLLSELGFDVSYLSLAEGRESLIASIGGSDARPAFCFTGHLDTVPLGAAPWSVDPHSGEIRGDRLYGRGASDMKAGIGAFIAAAARYGRELKNGPGVMLLLTASEETGCQGAHQIASTPLPLRAGCLVVGEPTANVPVIAHKGALWLNARTRGKTAHGSMPHLGENAIYRAAEAIGLLQAFEFKHTCHALLGSPTLNVGTINGGLNINSVPDQTDFTIDLRTVPGVEHSALADDLGSYLGDRIELRTMVDAPSLSSDPDHPWVKTVFDIVAREQGASPKAAGVTYFTDGPVLHRALGPVQTVVLGPGEPSTAHQTDEYCLVSKIEEACRIYAALIEDWYR
jgi:succinyl-diaminopimelate desuccinylase